MVCQGSPTRSCPARACEPGRGAVDVGALLVEQVEDLADAAHVHLEAEPARVVLVARRWRVGGGHASAGERVDHLARAHATLATKSLDLRRDIITQGDRRPHVLTLAP